MSAIDAMDGQVLHVRALDAISCSFARTRSPSWTFTCTPRSNLGPQGACALGWERVFAR
jgi:hypothetical protein